MNELKIPGRGQAIQSFRQQGGQIAAVFPIHYPRALLRAFDLLPVEVWGPPGRDPVQGNAHLQAYTCSIVRCGLSYIEQGKLDHMALVLVPHACDSLQGLGSLLLDFYDTPFAVETFYVPRGRRDADQQFLVAELGRLHEALVTITGKQPDETRLRSCVEREERADAALAALLKARPGLQLTNRRFYELVRSREYLPAEEFEPLARGVAQSAGEDRGEGLRVVLSGLVPEPMALLDVLDNAGVIIAGDDMASSGRRLYATSDLGPPLERLAWSLLHAPADPTRGWSVEAHLQRLLTLARRGKARGVVHFDIKFCEPEQFYIPQVDQGLRAAGIKTLSVEVDLAEPLPDQIVTRLEAFAEALT